MGALITYLNVEHSLPYDRLSQITHDLLGFAISEGTIANKLAHMQKKAEGIIQRIKEIIIQAPWIGSDETRSKVAGKGYWQWVWQSPWASYFVVVKSRGYAVVKEYFTESYAGVMCHDCWCAQNKTPAGKHQLCHAHLLRNLQYVIDKERSVWAYRVQRLLRKCQRAREAIWKEGVSPALRDRVIREYLQALDVLNRMALTGTEEHRLQKRLIKHRDWIFTDHSLTVMYPLIIIAPSEPSKPQNSRRKSREDFALPRAQADSPNCSLSLKRSASKSLPSFLP
jgi:hypothetical protein